MKMKSSNIPAETLDVMRCIFIQVKIGRQQQQEILRNILLGLKHRIIAFHNKCE